MRRITNSSVKWSLLVLVGMLFSLLFHTGASDDNRQAYIVYLGELPKGDDISVSDSHSNMLHQLIGSEGRSSLLHSYKRSFNGFVAMLTEDEKERLAVKEGVVSVFPDENNHLHTTRSWDFMGFSQQVNRTTVESDIIIGVLDTGIWPESDSFSDKGFGPPPAKWKGICQNSTNITCNNKIIGARYYRSSGLFQPEDLVSPRDSDGHGTHTASTAAGGLVSSASLTGLGQGTARGGVPSARIAVYKICWETGCSNADILAAFDDAIADGVDIISLSVGGFLPRQYFRDSIAIGSFHAMKNGILTSNSAGNEGPSQASITNFSPWSLSVAASTIDRKFSTKVQLGNNMVYQGVSINTFEGNMYPIIYGGDAPNKTGNYTSSISRFCFRNSLDSNLVKGKVVLCEEIDNGAPVFLAGASGVVIYDDGDKDVPRLFPLPGTYLGDKEGTNIFNYINTTSNPTATILKSDEVAEPLAPFVATFSSRGPNPVSGDILKPDITAPGVAILAAWSPIAPVSTVPSDTRRTLYNIKSGTSMSCPHATAVAAYIKSFYPSWSPAAIKSAIMTTAFPLNTITSPDAEFGYGSGHIDPLKATNPGLIYDIEVIDYIKFLCAEGYNSTMLQFVTGDNSSCGESNPQAIRDLNLPSFALSVLPLEPFSGNFTRTVTNVGSPISTYNVTVSTGSEAVKIEVEPRSLSFTSLGQKLSYIVKVEGLIGRTRVSGSLVWSDGERKVRSPVVVYAT